MDDASNISLMRAVKMAVRAGYAFAAGVLAGVLAGGIVWWFRLLPEYNLLTGVALFVSLAACGAALFRKSTKAIIAAGDADRNAMRAETEELRSLLQDAAREAETLRERMSKLDLVPVLSSLDEKVRALKDAAGELSADRSDRLAALEKENRELKDKLARAAAALKGEM